MASKPSNRLGWLSLSIYGASVGLTLGALVVASLLTALAIPSDRQGGWSRDPNTYAPQTHTQAPMPTPDSSDDDSPEEPR